MNEIKKVDKLFFYTLLFIAGLSSVFSAVLADAAPFRIYLNVLLFCLLAVFLLIAKLIMREKLCLPVFPAVMFMLVLGIFSSLYNHSLPAPFARGFVLLILPFVIFYVVTNTVWTTEQRNRILKFLFIFAFISGAMGIYEHFTAPPSTWGFYFQGLTEFSKETSGAFARDLSAIEMGRIGGPLMCPGSFGGYLIMVIPLIFAFILISDSKIEKVSLIVTLAVCLSVLMWTYTRSAWIGLCAGLLFFSFFRKRRTLWWIFFLVILLLFMLNPVVRERLITAILFPNVRTQEYYPQVIAQIKMHPLIGNGLGVYAKEMNFRESHNMYLEIMLKIGILGLAAFIFFFYKAFKNYHNIRKESSFKDRVVIEAVAASMIAYLVQGMFESMIFAIKCNWFFMMLIAFLFIKSEKSADV